MTTSNYIIAPESPADYLAAENLTREAFWNVYQPGCDEHYILHTYRNRPEFIPELTCVLKIEGKLVAHIMYSRAVILADDGRAVPAALFGPVSVHPDHQRQGYGSAIIRWTMKKAEEMGIGVLAISGKPAYYNRFGFVDGQSKGIYYGDVPRDKPTPFFMVKELIPGYLDGVVGTYHDPEGYFVNPIDVEEFDRQFPPKVKEKRPGQIF